MKTYECNSDYLQYTASQQTYVSPVWHIAYSEGAQAIFSEQGCYWLLDQVAPKFNPSTARQAYEGLLPDWEFNVIRLKMIDESSAVIRIEDGNGKALVQIAIPFTDFNYMGGLRLFVAPTQVIYKGAEMTTFMIYLPSEH